MRDLTTTIENIICIIEPSNIIILKELQNIIDAIKPDSEFHVLWMILKDTWSDYIKYNQDSEKLPEWCKAVTRIVYNSYRSCY